MDRQQRREWIRRVLGSSELTAAHKTVLIALETFADYRNGANAYPGIDTLASMCRVDEKTVRRALDAAWKRLGLIERTARANPKAHKASAWRLVSTGQQSPVEDVSTGQQSPVDTPMEADFYRASSAFLPDNFDVSTGLQSPPTLGEVSIEGGVAESGTGTTGRIESPNPPPSEQSANGKPATWVRGPYGPRCPDHVNDPDPPSCRGCRDARISDEAHKVADAERNRQHQAAEIQRRHACPDCDDAGWLLGDDGKPTDDAIRCTHPRLAPAVTS